MMRIRVVSVDGQPINGIQAMLRNFLLVVDALPPFVIYFMPFPLFQVGLLAAMMNDRFQRLGDLAAGTMVVVEEGHWLRGLTHSAIPKSSGLRRRFPSIFWPNARLPGRSRRTSSGAVRSPGAGEWKSPGIWPSRSAKSSNLPPSTNLDMLLCVLYYRTFITERQDEEPAQGGSPFAEPKIRMRLWKRKALRAAVSV